MPLNKKEIKLVNGVSVIEEVVTDLYPRMIGRPHWLDTPPENWLNEEKEIFDLVSEIEYKYKTKLFEALKINNP